jgi:hypothetical protein
MGYAIRVLAPKRYAGDVFTLAKAETRDDYEEFRWHLACPENFETVELDDDGRVKP